MDGSALADPIPQRHDGEVLADARCQWTLTLGILGFRRRENSGSRHLTHGQTDIVIIRILHTARTRRTIAQGCGTLRIKMHGRIGEAHNGGGSGRRILRQISRRIHVPRITPARYIALVIALLLGKALDGIGVVRDDSMPTGWGGRIIVRLDSISSGSCRGIRGSRRNLRLHIH
eukprot:scaffold602982_cov71-Attheya_sp.AAC.1